MVHLDVTKADGGGWRVHGKGSEQAKQVERAKNAGTGKSGAQHGKVERCQRILSEEFLYVTGVTNVLASCG
jgi:hypothetical protein